MKQIDSIEYDWPETGKLAIMMRGSDSAALRFIPSETAIRKWVEMAAKGSTNEGDCGVSSNTQRG